MPVLKTTDTILTGSTPALIAYTQTARVWPDPETWSAWYEVGYSVLAAPSAWFAGGVIDHYDAGTHERVRFRYSNKGRIQWRGIMKNISAGTLAGGYGVIGCNISDANVPKPVNDNRMIYGVSGLKTDFPSVYGGTVVRYNLAPYEYHHLVQLAVHDATPMASGMWFGIDGIASFATDT